MSVWPRPSRSPRHDVRPRPRGGVSSSSPCCRSTSSTWSGRSRCSTRSIASRRVRSTRSRSSRTADRPTVEGEGGVLTFLARNRFEQGPRRLRHRAPRLRPRLEVGAGRGALRVAETEIRRSAPARRRVCRLLPAGRGRLAERPAGDDPLEVRPRARGAVPGRPRRARAALGQGRERLHLGGISAGIDLALAWVEEDCGAGLAHEAARELVLFLRRPGGQPQLSVSLSSQASEMTSIRELQIWIAENLGRRLSIEDLAERMAMSVRNFERVFTREVARLHRSTFSRRAWRRPVVSSSERRRASSRWLRPPALEAST